MCHHTGTVSSIAVQEMRLDGFRFRPGHPALRFRCLYPVSGIQGVLPAQGLRRGFASPSVDGGLELFFEFCRLRGEVSDLRRQPGDQLPQSRDLRIPIRQQPPQPRVHRTQIRSGIIRRIGHDRHYTTAAPAPQIDEQRTGASRPI